MATLSHGMPRPFSQWRSYGPLDGGVGAGYPALDQTDQDAYGSTWTSPNGAVYQKIYTNGWNGSRIISWERVR